MVRFLIDESSCTTVIICTFCGDWRCIDLSTERALSLLFEHVVTVSHDEPTPYLIRLVRALYARRGLTPWPRLERLAQSTPRAQREEANA